MEEINEGIADFSAAWDLPDFVLAIIQNNDEVFFQTGRPYIEKIIPLLPMYFVNYRGKIQLHYTSAAEALLGLKEAINMYNTESDAQLKGKLIGEIAIFTFILGKKNRNLSDTAISECNGSLSKAAQIMYEYLNDRGREYDIEYVNGPRPLSQLVTEGLLESRNYADNYPKAVAILASLDDEYLFFDQLVDFNLHNYFNEIIGRASSDFTDDLLQEICTMMYCIPALKNKISFYRNTICELANVYIDTNSAAFQEKKSENKVEYLLRLLERGEEAINDNDRRFFIENMLRNNREHLPYFKTNFLPTVLSKYIVVYHPVYWEFISSYLDENDESSVQIALLMYTNPSIYQYSTNAQYIENLLRFLFRLESKPFYPDFIKTQAENILAIASQTLAMLKQSNVVSSKIRNSIIAIIEELLMQDVVKNEIIEHFGKYRKNGIVNSAYILLYYFDDDTSFNLGINYWQKFVKNNQRRMIVQYIYSAIIVHGVLLEKEINKIKDVTGEEFIDELYKYHEQMKVYNFPFVKEQFVSLCSN